MNKYLIFLCWLLNVGCSIINNSHQSNNDWANYLITNHTKEVIAVPNLSTVDPKLLCIHSNVGFKDSISNIVINNQARNFGKVVDGQLETDGFIQFPKLYIKPNRKQKVKFPACYGDFLNPDSKYLLYQFEDSSIKLSLTNILIEKVK